MELAAVRGPSSGVAPGGPTAADVNDQPKGPGPLRAVFTPRERDE